MPPFHLFLIWSLWEHSHFILLSSPMWKFDLSTIWGLDHETNLFPACFIMYILIVSYYNAHYSVGCNYQPTSILVQLELVKAAPGWTPDTSSSITVWEAHKHAWSRTQWTGHTWKLQTYSELHRKCNILLDVGYNSIYHNQNPDWKICGPIANWIAVKVQQVYSKYNILF